MAGKTGSERRTAPPMVLGERSDDQPALLDDRPSIESDGRYARPSDEPPPDPRAVIEDLRRRLRIEEERSLNAVDAVLGARAAAAQAKAEAQETFYRLHVRETELAQLKELIAGDANAGDAGDTMGPGPLGSVGSDDRAMSTAAQAQQRALRSLRTAGSAVKRMLDE